MPCCSAASGSSASSFVGAAAFKHPHSNADKALASKGARAFLRRRTAIAQATPGAEVLCLRWCDDFSKQPTSQFTGVQGRAGTPRGSKSDRRSSSLHPKFQPDPRIDEFLPGNRPKETALATGALAALGVVAPLPPLMILSTVATIIASRSIITAAFSMTHQASQRRRSGCLHDRGRRFLTRVREGIPPVISGTCISLALPQNVVAITVQTTSSPWVVADQRLQLEQIAPALWLARASYGFMESPDLPSLLADISARRCPVNLDDLTYFIGVERIVPKPESGVVARWMTNLFAAMVRHSAHVTDSMRIPPERLVDLGRQVVI